MSDTGWYRWVCTLMYVAVSFAEVKARLWTKTTATNDVMLIGDVSSRAMSRSHCALICGMQDMCYGFEYDNKTNMCDVFYGVQSPIGSQSFSRYSVFTHKGDCVRDDYTLLNGGELCFKVNSNRLTWDDAFSACQEDEGRLLVFRNSKQMEDLLTAIPEQLGGKSFWIGLTDRSLEGEWVFIDGTVLIKSEWPSASFNNKCPGDGTIQSEVDCGALSSGRGYLTDCYCNKPRRYICERPQIV